MGTPVPCGLAGVVTPMGCVSLSWLRETADPDATEADVRARAAGFFPWWEPGVDEQARVGVGRAALWRFPWHPPQRRGDRARERRARLPRSDTDEPRPRRRDLAPRHRGAGDHDGDPARSARPPCGRRLRVHAPDREAEAVPGLHARAARATSTSRTTTTDHAKVYWFGDRVVRVGSWLVTQQTSRAAHAARARRAQHGARAGAARAVGRFAIEAPPVTGYCVLLEPDDGETSRERARHRSNGRGACCC